MSVTAWQQANDAELISAVRGDDEAAWAELCHRHLGAARRFARTLVPAKAVDELVDRASEHALADLRAGEGPDLAFRPFILAAVRSEQRSLRTAAGEDRPAVRAFHALPERWQLVLWHVGVEREQPHQVAPLIGVAESAVRGVTGRAHAGLRAETLGLYDREADELGPDCGRTREHLVAHLRGATTRRESGSVETHLQTCLPCRALHDELAAVRDDLAGVLGPVVLGSTGVGYLAPREGRLGSRRTGRAALAGVAAAVALVTGLAVGLGGNADGPPVADPPVAGPPEGQQLPLESGATLQPSASDEPDDTTPTSTTSDPAAPIVAPDSPAPPADSPSGDPTISVPGTSGSPGSPPPPPDPPPTPAPSPPVDPAVSARLPKLDGPVAVILVEIDDVAETDGRLTVVPQDPDVKLAVGEGCARVTVTSSVVCDLAEDASTVEIVADLSAVTAATVVDVAITPGPDVVEMTPAQRGNNQISVPLEAPSS